jgi:glycosyltransferase involved in cell wall biosynthesis
MKKKISVIVPCYNAELYIDRCLDSIVNQTIGIENMQIILIDIRRKPGN